MTKALQRLFVHCRCRLRRLKVGWIYYRCSPPKSNWMNVHKSGWKKMRAWKCAFFSLSSDIIPRNHLVCHIQNKFYDKKKKKKWMRENVKEKLYTMSKIVHQLCATMCTVTINVLVSKKSDEWNESRLSWLMFRDPSEKKMLGILSMTKQECKLLHSKFKLFSKRVNDLILNSKQSLYFRPDTVK